MRTEGSTSESKQSMLAQYFTPPDIAEFVWDLVTAYADLGIKSRVLDPAAGDGAFLKAALASQLVDPSCLHGVEVDSDLTARMSCALAEVHVHLGNGLFYEGDPSWLNSFDVVIGNPPYGRLQLAWESHAALGKNLQYTSGFAAAELVGGKASKVPVELLFLERAIQLAKSDGVVALILPQGFFTNQRLQRMRDWTLDHTQMLAVFDLPDEVFRRSGLNARTGLLILRKANKSPSPPAPLLFSATPGQKLGQYLNGGRQAVRFHVGGSNPIGIRDACLVASEKMCHRRWDAGYWSARKAIMESNWPVTSLGDFIAHLTYGPIITGKKPEHSPGGVPVIYQRNIQHTGVHLENPLCVPPESEFDPPRSRVQQGDLLLPRSGAGTLGQNRMAAYSDRGHANVGCFVDLIRFEGINPFYVWFFLKTSVGRNQIASVINGVGMPNINFTEIRALEIAVVPEEFQCQVEADYLEKVLPLHKRSNGGPEVEIECERRFHLIVDKVGAWIN